MGPGRPARDERRAVLLRVAADRPPAARAPEQRLRPAAADSRTIPSSSALGIAAAYAYAADHRDRYADFFEADGSLAGPGYTEAEAEGLPTQYRLPGVVVKPAVPAGDTA